MSGANKKLYLRLGPLLEASGRKLVYQTARKEQWIVEVGDEVRSFSLVEYSPVAWRFTEHPWDFVRSDLRASVFERLQKNRSRHLELSFAPEEMRRCVSWALDHLDKPIGELPSWLDGQYKLSTDKPLEGYCWSKKGSEAQESWRRERTLRAGGR